MLDLITLSITLNDRHTEHSHNPALTLWPALSVADARAIA
jgi:hypothetical protein